MRVFLILKSVYIFFLYILKLWEGFLEIILKKIILKNSFQNKQRKQKKITM